MSELALPEGWVEALFTDCIEILDNQRKPINNTERQSRILGKDESELYPYYGATGQAGWIDDYLFNEELIALGEDGVPFLDISKHKAYMLQGKTWVNNHAHVLKAVEGVALNKYLLHFFNSIDYLGYVNGGTRLKLTQVNMKKIPVILPSLNEQKEIVRLLSTHLTTVSQIQARLDAIPKLLEKFRQSVIRDAVSGELVSYKPELDEVETISLEDVIASSMNGLSKRSGDTGEEEIVLRLADFKDAKRTYGGERKIRITSKELEKYRIDVGDILIVRVNGSADLAGKFILYKEEGQPEAFCDHFIKIKLDLDKARPEFVILIANEGEGRHYLRNSLSTSAGQNTINQKSVKGLEFRLPPLEIQDKIIQIVKQFFVYADQIEKSVATAKARVDHLTQSILYQAFTGNLTAEWREQNPDLISGDNSAEALLAKIEAEKKANKIKKKK